MGIKLKNKISFSNNDANLRKEINKKLSIALLDATEEITRRTLRGLDISGSKFKPYTPEYAKRKRDTGRNTNVNLTYTGAMLAALTSNVSEQADKLVGTISFSTTKEALKASFNNKIRPFFGFSKVQVVNIKDKIKEAINEWKRSATKQSTN